MKITIPVDENKLETAVCVSFGRAPYLMFYDTDSKKAAFHSNSMAEAQSGAGLKTAQFIVDSKADALLKPEKQTPKTITTRLPAFDQLNAKAVENAWASAVLTL